MRVADHYTAEELERILRAERDGRVRDRLRIVLRAKLKSEDEAGFLARLDAGARPGDGVAVLGGGKRVRVYVQDKARFGQQGTLTRVWAPTGSRPTAVKQTDYAYLWVLGAVCPETGHSVGLLAPRLDTRVVNAFLAQFSRELPEGEHALLVWDQADYHTAKALQVPDNVTLLRLPPYSPELNPVENLWHYLRSHFWSNRLYRDYTALEAAAMHAWRSVCLIPERIQSICAAPYLNPCNP